MKTQLYNESLIAYTPLLICSFSHGFIKPIYTVGTIPIPGKFSVSPCSSKVEMTQLWRTRMDGEQRRWQARCPPSLCIKLSSATLRYLIRSTDVLRAKSQPWGWDTCDLWHRAQDICLWVIVCHWSVSVWSKDWLNPMSGCGCQNLATFLSVFLPYQTQLWWDIVSIG